jgi:hypothetical protein
MSDATLATIAENLGVDFPDDDAKKDALFDALNELIDEAGESAELRTQVFAAVDDYAHGRLLLFELCDRIGAPYPSDKKVVSLAARVKEIEAENAALRAEVTALRLAADEVLSWSLNDTTALLTNPPQNAALFHAQRVLRAACDALDARRKDGD